jgi:GxxExxY protein
MNDRIEPQSAQRAPSNDVLTRRIIGAAIEVHKTLGPGLLESIDLQGIRHRRQVEIDVVYKGKVIKGQRIDVLVEDQVIVEIKSLSKLPEVSTAQTLSYLKATGLKRGLLFNFGAKMLRDGVKRISL